MQTSVVYSTLDVKKKHFFKISKYMMGDEVVVLTVQNMKTCFFVLYQSSNYITSPQIP